MASSSRVIARTRSDHAVTWIIVGLVALLLFAIAYWALMVWWLVWSILDLASGNPVTWWNVLGIVWPSLSLVSMIVGNAKR